MKSPRKIIGPFFIAMLAVYSGKANLADAADQPGDAKPGVSVTNTQVVVNDAGAVEIHVNDANLLEVLRMLSLQSRKNIIASKNVSGNVTANLYNVTVTEALDAILQSNGFVYRQKGNFIYVYTAKELADLDRASRVMATRVFRLSYTPAADAMAMIKPVLTTDGTVQASTAASKGIDTSAGTSGTGSTGGGSGDTGGNSYAGGDLLVVTDDSAKLDVVADLLKQIDHRPQQVLIEATIMAATLTDNNSLGVDFSVMGGVKFGQFLNTPAQTITNATSGALQNSTSKAGISGYGAGATSFANPNPGQGLNVGFLSNNVSVFVNALEAINNTTILANPKILALDRQQAEVHVGNVDFYQNSTTATQTASIQSAQEFDTGTILSVRPFVGADGFIRMEIHPSDSVGGIVNNLPHSSTTEVTSNVMVKDGHTVVIGGLFRDESERDRSQIPGLGSIPFLGVLFRQSSDQSKRQEIIILITPHLIQDESAYAQLSEEQMKRAEDLRVGMRKGMMFFGRERLAELAYENAVSELAKPNPDRGMVLWHLNNATNLNPTFLEAIELKEKVSGKRVTDVDNSAIRDFISQSILTSDVNMDSK